jgi:hypothetical protein
MLPCKLTARTSSNSSAGCLWNIPPTPMAALATQISSRPQRRSAAATMAWPAPGSAASEYSVTASPPAAVIWSATRSAGPCPSASTTRLRLLTTTMAPCLRVKPTRNNQAKGVRWAKDRVRGDKVKVADAAG